MALQLRPRYRLLTNPTLLHFYSFSSSSNPFDPSPEDPTNAQSSVSSLFGDVKASLKHQPPRPPKPPSPFSRPSSPPPSKTASLEEISRNLSQFRIRTAAPPDSTSSSPPSTAPPDSTSSSHPISFQELYKKNVTNRNDGSNVNPGSRGRLSYEGIRESLKKIRTDGNWTQQTERRGEGAEYLRDSLRLRPAQSNADSRVIDRSEALPLSVFEKEMGQRKDWANRSEAMRTEFVKMYDYEDLGKKLRTLRTGEGGFSVSELNERLVKLREMEEQEAESKHRLPFKDLRESLVNISMSGMHKSTTPVKHHVFGGLGLTPEYMMRPPQEHLVEKYFHPDNMSAAEKLNLELQKVREDFKMSESDCGSARVQVAQLTTKIKHLSSVLHKKDKHSRKGLVAMVQRRKKLLKYLRRTDWDSYCFVLSKLGLRDNLEYKN